MIAQGDRRREPAGHRGLLRAGRRRAVLALLLLGLGALSWSCFPAPVAGLWPPRPGEPRHRVDVVFRDWHTVIVEDVSPETPPFRDWEYCEEAWYLEGRQGLGGVLRALLWPTASAVGRREAEAPLWERHAAGDLRHWTFYLSEAGRRAMDAYLEAEKGPPLAAHPGWYRGTHRYHLFNACHHFTAGALRAGGLPIRPWWAFNGWLVGIQLDRVSRFHREAGLLPSG